MTQTMTRPESLTRLTNVGVVPTSVQQADVGSRRVDAASASRPAQRPAPLTAPVRRIPSRPTPHGPGHARPAAQAGYVGGRLDARNVHACSPMARPRPRARVRSTVSHWVIAALAGAAVALAAWGVLLVGTAASDAHTTAITGTSAEHVRSGESLSQLATRVAPNVHVAQVVADIRDLNQIGGSGLTAGQPILVPHYSR